MSRQRDSSSRRNFLNSRQANDSTTSYNRLNAATTTTNKGNEKTPLLNSIGAASEVMSKSMTGDVQTGLSWSVATFLLVNTALGAGMLNYPYAYNQIGGVLIASLTQVVST